MAWQRDKQQTNSGSILTKDIFLFSREPRSALGSNQPNTEWIPRTLFPWVSGGIGVKLTSQLHAAPTLRMRGDLYLQSLICFTTYTGTTVLLHSKQTAEWASDQVVNRKKKLRIEFRQSRL
jgi:hypothetical protein